MTQHTPGPWRTEKHAELAQHTVLAPNQNGDGLSELVAFGIDSEANARLIAAAPELLEALKIALTKIEEWQDESLAMGVPTGQVQENSYTIGAMLKRVTAKAETL